MAFTVTGNAQVNTFTIDWDKPGYSRHPIDLALNSATIARPV